MEQNKEIKAQELAANHYTNALIDKREKVNRGELMETEAFWQEWVLNFLKTQALVFIGESLRNLKLKGIEWAVDFSNWLMNELTELIINLYHQADEQERKTFKDKIIVAFPGSSILEKLN